MVENSDHVTTSVCLRFEILVFIQCQTHTDIFRHRLNHTDTLRHRLNQTDRHTHTDDTDLQTHSQDRQIHHIQTQTDILTHIHAHTTLQPYTNTVTYTYLIFKT